MKGTIFSVTRAMLRIPPTITRPTRHAKIPPISQPLSASTLCSGPPVTVTSCTKAWFDWNMLPMPRQPMTIPAA